MIDTPNFWAKVTLLPADPPAAPPAPMKAPASCPHCEDETDCASVPICNAVEAVYAAPPAHEDDLAVDRFAAAMKEKLAKKRAEGRSGWKGRCSNYYLSQLLQEHVEKGDPVDVGNLAMMIHQRGERIAQAGEVERLKAQMLREHHAMDALNSVVVELRTNAEAAEARVAELTEALQELRDANRGGGAVTLGRAIQKASVVLDAGRKET